MKLDLAITPRSRTVVEEVLGTFTAGGKENAGFVHQVLGGALTDCLDDPQFAAEVIIAFSLYGYAATALFMSENDVDLSIRFGELRDRIIDLAQDITEGDAGNQ